MAEPIRIGNASGFYGDRLSAAHEVVSGGPLDVLTGDWLAELTMYVLARRRLKRGPGTGYAGTFLDQLEQVLGPCLQRGIRIVSNAGGLDPRGLAQAVQQLAFGRGLRPRIAYLTGDDLIPVMDQLLAGGERLLNLDTGEPWSEVGATPLTANAYLGAFGIKSALDAGADIVITGRVTDASLVVGPAAWHHGWTPEDLDELAGATVAGHLAECGAQVTGGNYAFFQQLPTLEHLAFPVVEVEADGSAVITKHRGTDGVVDRGTVTAQLLYEIEGPLYAGPDVVTRLDTVRLEVLAPDRVRVSGARGEPPPDRLKVAVNYSGGFRNQVTFVLTGSDVEAKRDVVLAQLFASVPGGRDAFDTVEVQLLPHGDPHAEPVDLWHAQTELRVTVSSHDAQLVGRAFTARAVELTLTSVPGLFLPGPPPQPSPFAVYWPTTVAAAAVQPQCWLLGETGADDELPVPPEPVTPHREPLVRAEPDVVDPDTTGPAAAETRRPGKQMRPVRLPLGALVGARSGDKGGNANLGLWVRHDLPADLADELYDWLLEVLTPERLRSMVPEAADLRIDRYRLTNLRAVNFVLRGLLGRGVADSVSVDPQGKGLGEYLRARRIEVPAALAARIEAVTSQRDER